jgi:hypothetical protein
MLRSCGCAGVVGRDKGGKELIAIDWVVLGSRGADAHQDLFTRQCCGEGAPDWAVDFGSFSLPFPLPATGATVLRPIHPLFSTATLTSERHTHTHTKHTNTGFPQGQEWLSSAV